MADFPAMPLYTDAIVADTTHLTNEEFGVYMRHLIHAWRRPDCALPADDLRLANIVGVPLEKWVEIKPPIMALWTYDGVQKCWFQKKQKKVRKNLANFRAKQRGNALSRWKDTKDPPCQIDAKSMQPKPNKEKKEKEKKETSGNGGAATASSPDFDGRSSAAPSNETLTAEDIAAINARLSWH